MCGCVRRQARAGQVLRDHGVGTESDIARKELLVCLRLCESWHVSNRVEAELHHYSRVPEVVDILRCSLRTPPSEQEELQALQARPLPAGAPAVSAGGAAGV